MPIAHGKEENVRLDARDSGPVCRRLFMAERRRRIAPTGVEVIGLSRGENAEIESAQVPGSDSLLEIRKGHQEPILVCGVMGRFYRTTANRLVCGISLSFKFSESHHKRHIDTRNCAGIWYVLSPSERASPALSAGSPQS